MKLNEYKSSDSVEVLINNPRKDNVIEWREGTVVSVQMIYPENGSRHKPYPMVVVKVRRTYVKTTPRYRYLDGVKVFVDNSLEFYDKESTEGFIYQNQIRPLQEKEYLTEDEKKHPDYKEEL